MNRLDWLNTLGDEMGQVYAAVHDRLLINLARHFKYVAAVVYDTPGASFQYQAEKLAELGEVTRENLEIIIDMTKGGNAALMKTLEAVILDAIKDVEPGLYRAAEAGILNGGVSPPEISPRMTQAFEAYYNQAADRLNFVNTTMLESSEYAYRAAVSEVVNLTQLSRRILNAAVGETISGVESFNQAQQIAVNQIVENGIYGFVDHDGQQWKPETYVSMVMRTTYHNASRQAFWDRNSDFNNDLYLVSQHPGARPLCYPWQCKVISKTDNRRWETDGDGRPVQVYAQRETSYGEPAGLFGINCGHHPEQFIPGATKIPALRQDEDANAKTYAESQQQRGLERALRAARLRVEVEKVRKTEEHDKKAMKEARQAVKEASDRLDEFCEATGRKRRREREYAPVIAKWPDPEKYDPEDFPTDTRDALREYFRNRRN